MDKQEIAVIVRKIEDADMNIQVTVPRMVSSSVQLADIAEDIKALLDGKYQAETVVDPSAPV